MKLTKSQYDELIKAHPSLAPERVCTTKPEQNKGKPLDGAIKGKTKSKPRFTIGFEIYARRPCDWDNYWVKGIQDCLRNAGILYDDAWDVLEGSVVSKKAHTDEEVGMVITLTQIQ